MTVIFEPFDIEFPIIDYNGNKTFVIKNSHKLETEMKQLTNFSIQKIIYKVEDSNINYKILEGKITVNFEFLPWQDNHELLDWDIDEIEEEYLDGDIYYQHLASNVRESNNCDCIFNKLEAFMPKVVEDKKLIDMGNTLDIPFKIDVSRNFVISELFIEYLRIDQKGLNTLESEGVITIKTNKKLSKQHITALGQEEQVIETDFKLSKVLKANVKTGLVDVKKGKSGLEYYCVRTLRLIALVTNNDRNQIVALQNIRGLTFKVKESNKFDIYAGDFSCEKVDTSIIDNNKLLLQVNYQLMAVQEEDSIKERVVVSKGVNLNKINEKRQPLVRFTYVKSKDTIESIAKRFGVKKADIISFNKLASEEIRPGMIIKVPIHF